MGQPEQAQREAERKAHFTRQAAQASLLAPVLAFFVGLMAKGTPDLRWMGCFGPVFLLVGVVSAIVALVGVRRHGGRGVLGRALVGLGLNLLLIGAGVYALVSLIDLKRRVVAQREQKLAQAEQDGRDTFEKFPGWLGAGELDGAEISVASMDRRSPVAMDTNAGLGTKVTILNFAVNNEQGQHGLMFDPSSVKYQLADGSIRNAFSPRDIFGTARGDKAKLIAKYGGPVEVKAGTRMAVWPAFLPYELDMANVVAISIEVNHEEITVEGEYQTAEERRALVEEAMAKRSSGTPRFKSLTPRH